MDSILRGGTTSEAETPSRKRAHSSATSDSSSSKHTIASEASPKSPSPELPAKKKAKLVENPQSPQPNNNNDRLKSPAKETTVKKETVNRPENDPLASLAAFDRPSTSSSPSLVSLDDEDDLDKR